ncbi:MAG: hypothetical protein ACTSRA_14260 [Promethearchaeota archaeon]
MSRIKDEFTRNIPIPITVVNQSSFFHCTVIRIGCPGDLITGFGEFPNSSLD